MLKWSGRVINPPCVKSSLWWLIIWLYIFLTSTLVNCYFKNARPWMILFPGIYLIQYCQFFMVLSQPLLPGCSWFQEPEIRVFFCWILEYIIWVLYCWHGPAQESPFDLILWYIAKNSHFVGIWPVRDVQLTCIFWPVFSFNFYGLFSSSQVHYPWASGHSIPHTPK